MISLASTNEDTELLTKYRPSDQAIILAPHMSVTVFVHSCCSLRTGSPWATEPEDAVEKEFRSLLRMQLSKPS